MIASVAGASRAIGLDAGQRARLTEAARETYRTQLRSQFIAEEDPTGELARTDPGELERRITLRRRQHFRRLALKSSIARREARERAELEALVDAELNEATA